MKQNPFAAILVLLLFISGAVAVFFALNFGFSTRSLRRLQPQAMAFQARLNVAQALLTDMLEYSKRNPAIDPLLQSLNLKTNAPPSTTAPAPAPK